MHWLILIFVWHSPDGTFSHAEARNLCRSGKYHKISYTQNSDKMAYTNSVDPDQTARLISVYTVCLSNKYFKKELHKKQNLSQKGIT